MEGVYIANKCMKPSFTLLNLSKILNIYFFLIRYTKIKTWDNI